MAGASCSRRVALAGGAALGAAALAGPALPSTVLGAESPPRLRAGPAPLVLGHRGACAHRPEHTLASYARAIADGADFVEPDLVPTKDGVLVARHENNVAETTDVAARPEFATRKATKTIDGLPVTGWFTEDFTLAELKTLRAKERLGAFRPESQAYDGEFQIVTFDEMIDFVAAEAATRGRTIGLIPEIKHSTYFAGLGFAMEDRLLDALHAHSYLAHAPVIVQSFEIGNLKALKARLAGQTNIRLMQLTENTGIPADRAAAQDKRKWAERLIRRCDVGSAIITPAFNLPAKLVIHAVGPRWLDGTRDEPQLLERCYDSIFRLAAENNLRSLAIPSISTGIYHYPLDAAAEIAIRVARRHDHAESVIQFICFDDESLKAYEGALKH